MKRESVILRLETNSILSIYTPCTELKWFACVQVIGESTRFEPRVEISGFSLSPNEEYYLSPGSCTYLLSWTQSTIKVTGSKLLMGNLFISIQNDFFTSLVQLNILLHKERLDVVKQINNNIPPVVIVYGSNSTVNNIVAHTLCNYCTRSRWQPILVDLDCSSNQSIAIPGSIALCLLDSPIEPGLKLSLTTLSISYFVGTLELQNKKSNGQWSLKKIFLEAASEVARVMTKRFLEQAENINRASGAVIIAPYFVGADGHNFISQIASIFHSTHVVLTDNDDNLKNALTDEKFHLNSLHISNCDNLPFTCYTIPANHFASTKYQNRKELSTIFNDYFSAYGPVTLQPFVWSKPFDKILLLQIEEDEHEFKIVPVKQSALQGIIGCIVAIHLGVYSDKSSLFTPPRAYGRVHSINATGVFVMTNAQYIEAKLTFVVGSVR